jgi:hypothetical protein
VKTLLLCGVLLGGMGVARGQTLEGAKIPDSAVVARSGGARPTAPGEIPDIIGISNASNLTQGDIRSMISYFEWVLQTPLSVAQKNEMRRRLIADWTRPDSDLPRIITSRSAWGFIKGASTFDSAMFSDSLKSDDVRRLRNQGVIVSRLHALGSDPDAQWILALYAAARRPLAPGTPALTQPVADMLAGATVFALNEVAGQKIANDSPVFRAAFTRRLVSQWPRMSVAQRRQIAGIPNEWPSFKSFYWPYASAAGKEEKRVVWGRQLSPAFPEIRAVAARRAKAWEAIQAKKRAAWAKLSPAQREQLISSAMAQNMAATRANIAAMSASQMASHATNMNIINNSRSPSGPVDYYYVR